MGTSGQDGGIGSRYTVLPHTTKIRTTNLKIRQQELPDELNCMEV